MYLVNAEAPREAYAELLRTRQHQRAARRIVRRTRSTAPSARLRNGLGPRVRPASYPYARLVKS